MKKIKNSDAINAEKIQEDIKGQDNGIRLDEKDIAVIIKTGGRVKTPAVITFLPVLAMFLSILPGISRQSFNLDTARFGIISLLLSGIVVFYIRFKLSALYEKKLFLPIFFISFLGSLALLLFVPRPELFSFWMLGGIVIAMLFDQRLGMLVHFAFTVLIGICFLDSPKAVIHIMLTGLLMIMLSGALKHKETVVYASIIILSTNITLAFTLNNFIFRSQNSFNYIISLLCMLFVLVAAFGLNYIYDAKCAQKAGHEDNPASEQASQAAGQDILDVNASGLTDSLSMQSLNDAGCTDEKGDRAGEEGGMKDGSLQTDSSLELLCDQNNLLLTQLKQYSEALYAHSERIADLAFRAALEIGADARLAMAGGLYHEIGRIRGGRNHIEDGLAIAEEFKFPAELKAIIKEHNIRYGKPGSLEACLVMLADSLEASIEYVLKNKGNKYTTEKIIDSVFKLRMDKGIFDACPLKIKDYNRLREFFIKEYADYKLS